VIEILDGLKRWTARGDDVVLVRLVDLDGSGPRLPGAAMAVNAASEVLGSLTGGCIEGAVVTEALDLLASGGATEDGDPGGGRLRTFGYSDDDAFSVGLTCGGTVHVFVERLDAALIDPIDAAIADRVPLAVATVIEGPGTGTHLVVAPTETSGTLGDVDLDRVVARDARGELAAGRSGVRHYGAQGQANETTVAVFVDVFAPPPHMLVFGAVDFTASLVRVAKLLGYRVTVCDAREVFATAARFPEADEVVVDWPNRLLDAVGPSLTERDAVCILTHDHKFDVPAIASALATSVGYIGVMGSRRTHADRLERLAEAGVAGPALDRLMAPIGLDLGARTPDESAVALCAEIIACRTGRPAPSLRDSAGPIHR
jgi:xanthine dehydrogenase accessory factor